MPSTYTVNLGIEKPATGEQSGTWGDTTNTNFDILDQGINGAVRVTLTSAGSSGSPNALQITNGAASDGRNKWIEFYSSGDLGGSAYVQLDPNDAEKIVFIRNSLASSRSVLLFQGTYSASRDLEIPAGVDMVVKFDGGGASAATVTDVYTKLRATEITTPTLTATTADINGDLTLTGASYNAVWDSSDSALEFADNAKAIFGAGSDLQIFHDGSDSVIGDVGTGNLYIQSNGAQILLQPIAGEQGIIVNANADVGLYYDNAIKLATTSGGINVTGTVTSDGADLDGAVTINEAGASVDFRVESDNNANMLFVDGSANAVGIGTTPSYGLEVFKATSTVARIRNTAATGATPSTTHGEFVIESTDANMGMQFIGSTTANQRILFGDTDSGGPGQIVYDHTSNYMSFSANGAERARIDSGGDVGIGTSTIAAKLHVDAPSTTAPSLTFGATAGQIFQNENSELAFGLSNSSPYPLYVQGRTNANAARDIALQPLGGNVSIGTASASATLHVNKGTNASSAFPSGNWAAKVFNQTDSSTEHGLVVANRYAAAASTAFEVGGLFDNGDGFDTFFKVDGAGNVTINERSADVDFRVESDGNTHMLFVDGGNNRVGIGTNAPGQPLEILSNTAEVSLNSSSSTYSRVVHEHNGTAMWTTGTRAATDYHIFRESGSGNVVIDAGSLDVGGNDTGGAGLINVYGGTSGEGGEIRIFPSAAEDSTVDFWSVDVATDDLRVFNNLGDLALTAIANGSVDLYHDGGHKFSTTASGIALNGGQTNQISIKSTGGSGFTQGDIVIEGHASDSSPGTRGQGIYYFNEGNDRTYYSGTLYNNGTVWGVASTTGTSLATAAANTTNSLLAVDGVSGGVRIGTTSNIFNSATNERASIKNPSTGAALTLQSTDVTGGYPILYLSSTDTTAGQNAVVFQRTGGVVGTITTTASATAYNTSSDYRLKQNVTALTGAIDRVKTLSPKRFSFIAEPDKTVDGFLAHEVTTVPEAIVGTKDQVDADGNPVYQGIDQSKLVPLLTAALQEAVAKIESLETRIAALEAS